MPYPESHERNGSDAYTAAQEAYRAAQEAFEDAQEETRCALDAYKVALCVERTRLRRLERAGDALDALG